MPVYDLIIIGAGPAGITAAIYALRKRLSTLIITQMVGGQPSWTGQIENFPSYQVVTGADLTAKFQKHLDEYEAPMQVGETVSDFSKGEDNLITVTTNKSQYHGKALLIASGKKPRLLNVPGEVEFKGRGVTYCYICDGPLFAGKDVAVIGGGNSALEAAITMAKIAQKVYVVNLQEKFTGNAILVEKVAALENVEVFQDSAVSKISGDKLVSGIEINHNGEIQAIPVGGVIIEVGLIPNSEFAEMVEKNPEGEIVIDRYCATNVKGIFAAGDVTNVPEKQIVIAAGEGAKAAISASKYLSRNF